MTSNASRTCRWLRKLCRKRSNNVARHDKTPVKSTVLSQNKNILSRDTIFMSRRNDIMLWLLYIQKLQYMHFRYDCFCSVATYDIIFGVVRYIIDTYSMKQPDLYYFEIMQMTSSQA